jgi:hypothetical protein
MDTLRLRPTWATVLAWLAALALCGMVTAPQPPRHGYTGRPPGAEPLDGPLGEDSFRLFEDRGLSGASDFKRHITGFKPHRPHRLAGYIQDGMTSLRWDLPDGVVVVFYDHSNARGRQCVIWGSGEVRDLVPWRFTNRVARWAWFYVGGGENPSPQILEGRATRPLGTRPTRAPVPDDGMFLFTNGAFKGLRQKVSNVTELPPGELQPITSGPDGPLESLQSLQWNLPYGVIVVLYENPDLTGRQFAVWGKGELSSARRWGSEGTVAGWAWFFVGSPQALATPDS